MPAHGSPRPVAGRRKRQQGRGAGPAVLTTETIALQASVGVDIPEAHHDRVDALNAPVAHLQAASPR